MATLWCWTSSTSPSPSVLFFIIFILPLQLSDWLMTAAIGASTQPQEILTVSFNPTGFDRKVNGHRSCRLAGGWFLLFNCIGCQLQCYLKASSKARRGVICRNFGFTASRCVQIGAGGQLRQCRSAVLLRGGSARPKPTCLPTTAPGVHRWTQGWRTNWAAPA